MTVEAGLSRRIARGVAAFGLGPPVAVEAPGGDWPAVLKLLSREKLAGLALAAAGAGLLPLDDAQLRDLLERQTATMLWALGLERRLLGLAGAFEGAGIEALVLKGPALAHTVYPEPSLRAFGDLDLLVRTRDWGRALELLAELGFRRGIPEPRPGFGERFGNAAVHLNDAGVEIDLHRSLVIGAFGLWMQPDELFESSSGFELGGRRLRRLDDTALLLHACVHATLGFSPPLLVPVRDVAQVALEAAIDWERLADLARRWRLQGVVAHAFDAVEEVLGIALTEEAAPLRTGASSRQERRALRAYTERRSRGGTTLSTLEAIPGVRAKMQYLSALLFPGPDFLAYRMGGSGGGSLLRRWASPLRWLSRGDPAGRP